jgi:hypothetical protein
VKIPYRHNTEKPPLSTAVRHGTLQAGLPVEDTAKYLLDPDDDFARPYLAIPGGAAFVWPVGVEGFELQDQAELGRHKYLGEIELDVDVIHKAETTITLSGTFPGWTSVENMQALRGVFFADTPERGKILHLPGILPNLQYVVAERGSFTHAQDERTQDIAYALTLVKVGTGKRVSSGTTRPNAGQGTAARGRGTRKFRVTANVNTLRKIAYKVFRNGARWTELYAVKANAKWFDKRNISSHRVPDYRLPLGTVIYY